MSQADGFVNRIYLSQCGDWKVQDRYQHGPHLGRALLLACLCHVRTRRCGVQVPASLVSLLRRTLILLGQDITRMTPFNLNYLRNTV